MDTVEESNDHIYIGGRKIAKKVTGTVKLGNKKYKVVKGVVKATSKKKKYFIRVNRNKLSFCGMA